MKISYAITACNEEDEIVRLIDFLLKNKRYEDEIYVLLDKSKATKHIQKSLENYRNGSVNILLLTTIQYSAGIDLINTTDIILYHDMTEHIKTQIIGRANRIGRKIPLMIHHLS